MSVGMTFIFIVQKQRSLVSFPSTHKHLHYTRYLTTHTSSLHTPSPLHHSHLTPNPHTHQHWHCPAPVDRRGWSSDSWPLFRSPTRQPLPLTTPSVLPCRRASPPHPACPNSSPDHGPHAGQEPTHPYALHHTGAGRKRGGEGRGGEGRGGEGRGEERRGEGRGGEGRGGERRGEGRGGEGRGGEGRGEISTFSALFTVLVSLRSLHYTHTPLCTGVTQQLENLAQFSSSHLVQHSSEDHLSG